MTLFMDVAQKGLQALLQLLSHPFYYIGILFIVLQYRRQILFERKLFHTKLHSLLSETWRTVLWGWIGGIAASVLMAVVGATIQAEAIILLWIVSLALILFRVRFFCWAYAIGLLGAAQAVLGWFPQWSAGASGVGAWFADALRGLNMPALLALVAGPPPGGGAVRPPAGGANRDADVLREQARQNRRRLSPARILAVDAVSARPYAGSGRFAAALDAAARRGSLERRLDDRGLPGHDRLRRDHAGPGCRRRRRA
ncbi:hypothetical protein ACHHV8_35895 [Paenibacillus sp. TAB 01]|uniref:hypothetical protein n=1 Tax=Paenibacillus sp. TAB 01 TaxID=3368988 RepID=UPI0037520B9C